MKTKDNIYKQSSNKLSNFSEVSLLVVHDKGRQKLVNVKDIE